MERYTRQIILPEIGQEGQRKLSASSVLIVGLGGLGSPVSLYLTGMGVGRIGLCDNDIVSLSNLHRQILYSETYEGLPKTLAAYTRLVAFSPHTKFDLWYEGLTAANAKKIISGYDIVVDCTDNHTARYLIDDTCAELGRTWIYGAVGAFDGYVSTFKCDGPRYSDIFPDRKLPSASTRSTDGVFPSLPGIIGLLEATEAIKQICGFGETLAGKLLLFNLKEMTFNTIDL